MKRDQTLITFLILILGVTLSVTAPAGAQVITKKETIVHYGVQYEFVRTADNFIILYDSSSSTKAPYEGGPMTMLEAEKQIIKEHMDVLPELNWNAGLYSHTPGAFSFSADETFYSLKPYNKAEFAKAIDKLPTRPSGPTLLTDAFKKLNKAMEKIKGRTVVFLFTDGSHTRGSYTRESVDPNSPLSLAQEMAQKYDICFYVISSAKGERARMIIDDVASINECSRVVPFEDLLGKPEYTTGALYVLEAKWVPYVETRDRVVGVEIDDILFDHDQVDIKPDSYAELALLGEFLQKKPQAYAVLTGFTDDSGDRRYNMRLSRRRAESVAAHLYDRFDIHGNQVVLLWYGAADPVASNDTPEGRDQNRRVECFVGGLY